jgi:hypothetical protein
MAALALACCEQVRSANTCLMSMDNFTAENAVTKCRTSLVPVFRPSGPNSEI